MSEVVADSRVIAARQLRKVSRKPTLIVFALVQPVMLLLLFRYVFGGAIDTGGVDYVDFLIPGIIVQSAIFGALMTGIGLSEDLTAGVVDRFRSLPMAQLRRAHRTHRRRRHRQHRHPDRHGARRTRRRLPTQRPAHHLAIAVVVVLAFSYVFSWISGFIGLAIRDPETVQGAGLIWVLPVTFASSAFVPTSSMPAAVQSIAEINPMTLAVDAVRALTTGHGEVLTPVVGDLRLAHRTARRVRAARRSGVPTRPECHRCLPAATASKHDHWGDTSET